MCDIIIYYAKVAYEVNFNKRKERETMNFEMITSMVSCFFWAGFVIWGTFGKKSIRATLSVPNMRGEQTNMEWELKKPAWRALFLLALYPIIVKIISMIGVSIVAIGWFMALPLGDAFNVVTIEALFK